MEQIIWKYLGTILTPNALIIVTGLFIIYKQIKSLIDKIDKTNTDIKQLEKGVKTSLLAHLTRIHSNVMQNQYISKDNLRIAEEVYKQYSIMNGNGYGTAIINEIRKLPIKN